MAFLGGLFGGGSKTTTTTTSTTATSVDNVVSVGAEISPTINANITPNISNAVDLTGIGEGVGKIAEVLGKVTQTVADQVAAQAKATEEKPAGALDTLTKFGGAATAILAILTIFFALKDPEAVKVQL